MFTLLPLLALSYIGWHVWCLLPVKWYVKTIVIAMMVASFLLLFAGFRRATDSMPMPLATTVYVIGTSSIFILLYLFMLFLALDLGRLVHLIPRTLLYNNWRMAGGITVFIFGLFLYGHLNYKHKVRQELTIASKKVTKPFKAVLLSDLHLGYHNQRDELHRWVDIINSEKPDLILIAGDIIDGSMRPLKEQRMHEEFRLLQAPVYACLGNHEYFSGQPDALQFYKDAGIHLLMDDTAIIDSTLVIIGRDDAMNRKRKTLADLAKTIDKSIFSIVLDHQPHHLERAEKAGIDFQFSGHTHRGQVWPISWITDAVYECSWGSHQRGDTHYYISSGMGIWGGMFRIGTQSEYVVLEIRGIRNATLCSAEKMEEVKSDNPGFLP